MSWGRARVWFHRIRAAFWLVLMVLVFPLGWQDSLVLIVLASLYANLSGDLSAAEAADDHLLADQLAEISAKLDQLVERTEHP